jgi:hypothetical protein
VGNVTLPTPVFLAGGALDGKPKQQVTIDGAVVD